MGTTEGGTEKDGDHAKHTKALSVFPVKGALQERSGVVDSTETSEPNNTSGTEKMAAECSSQGETDAPLTSSDDGIGSVVGTTKNDAVEKYGAEDKNPGEADGLFERIFSRGILPPADLSSGSDKETNACHLLPPDRNGAGKVFVSGTPVSPVTGALQENCGMPRVESTKSSKTNGTEDVTLESASRGETRAFSLSIRDDGTGSIEAYVEDKALERERRKYGNPGEVGLFERFFACGALPFQSDA